MKRLVLGTIVGIAAVVFAQRLYNKKGKFYSFVEGVKDDLNNPNKTPVINVEGAVNAPNIFDKASVIWRRLVLVVFN